MRLFHSRVLVWLTLSVLTVEEKIEYRRAWTNRKWDHKSLPLYHQLIATRTAVVTMVLFTSSQLALSILRVFDISL
jgi:hypothetical protein